MAAKRHQQHKRLIEVLFGERERYFIKPNQNNKEALTGRLHVEVVEKKNRSCSGSSMTQFIPSVFHRSIDRRKGGHHSKNG